MRRPKSLLSHLHIVQTHQLLYAITMQYSSPEGARRLQDVQGHQLGYAITMQYGRPEGAQKFSDNAMQAQERRQGGGGMLHQLHFLTGVWSGRQPAGVPSLSKAC